MDSDGWTTVGKKRSSKAESSIVGGQAIAPKPQENAKVPDDCTLYLMPDVDMKHMDSFALADVEFPFQVPIGKVFETLNSKGHKFVTGTFSKPVIAWHADNNRHHPPNGIFLNFATTKDADESGQKLDGKSLDLGASGEKIRIRVFKKAIWTVGRFDKQFLELYANGGPLPSTYPKQKQGLQHQPFVSQSSIMSKLEMQNDSELSYYGQLETSSSTPSCVDSRPHGHFSSSCHLESSQRFKSPGVASRVEEQSVQGLNYQNPYQSGFSDSVSSGSPLIHSFGPVWTGDEDVKTRLSIQRSQSKPIQIRGRRQEVLAYGAFSAEESAPGLQRNHTPITSMFSGWTPQSATSLSPDSLQSKYLSPYPWNMWNQLTASR